MNAKNLVHRADTAAAAGDLREAERCLAEASASLPDPMLFLKLAGLQRAIGDTAAALASVERALAITPREFTGLLLRASLLEKLGRPDAPQAWSNALAARPEGQLPSHLRNVVAEAERKVEQWTNDRDALLKAKMQAAESRATPEERRRIERFRSNVLRRTRHYHSEPTDFHFTGLREIEFHPRQNFPWLSQLEAATETLKCELKVVMAAERAELVPYVQYDEHMPLDQWKSLNHNLDWTAIHLVERGKTVEANARHSPRTIELLAKLPQPQLPGASPNAMFSLLKPGAHIPPHVGVNNARLVCHLPLIVPEGCWFRVGAETRPWNVGEAFVFDDTIEHEAMNPTDELRVVFIFDVWHPDLSEVEREAVAALISTDTGGGGL
jgi:aspartyl/asparaginyl beta-hydroxylase (cupin superfamily)